MAIKLLDNIRVGQQKPLEDKYFNELVPYVSTTEVNTLLQKSVRHIGLTVNINGEEYWYKDGIENENLVLKVPNIDTFILKNQEQDDRLENLENKNVSQDDLINDLSSSIDHENVRNNSQDDRLENLEGINYTWTPANRTLTLFDKAGNQLSQVSLVSLDNEGTALRYNSTTLSLELYNEANELLSSIPVSSFIGSVATLDNTGKVPSSQLPSYVDDVLEFANLASFPAIGESGKIYIAIDTNITYRWGGSSYVGISSSLALGETASTAYRGDRGKIAYDHSQVTHDKNLVGLGNVDNTSDLNKPISTATQTALNLKLSTEAPSTTGTVISFSTDKVYGTLTTPETGNITADVTNAKLGVTNIVIHNSGTAPTFGSGFKKLSGSGNYVTGVVNYIYCTFISNTEIIYSINQRS
jgi:hypothetical protein